MAILPQTVRLGLAFLACGALLALCAPAAADSFTQGEFETYDQNIWGADPADGPPASILKDHFFDVYPASVGFTVVFGYQAPGGLTMTFNDASFVADYLPQPGAPSALDHSVVNPHLTAAGVFGGQVVAFGLNLDFADAGFLAHPSAMSFGDLVLKDLGGTLSGLNGLSLRQLDGVANAALGGGFVPYAIADLSSLLARVNASFEGGFPSSFAQADYTMPDTIAPVPEPSTLMLMLGSLAGFGAFAGRRRRAG